MTGTFRALVLSAALLLTAGAASAFSLGSNVGDRMLIVSITDNEEKLSYPAEIRDALKKGGAIFLDWENAKASDSQFWDNQVGSVFCGDAKESPDFDPDKTELGCTPQRPALATWIGKHGWHLHSYIPIANQLIFVKPWTAD